MELTWLGVPEFNAALSAIGERATVQARAAVAEAAAEVEKAAKLRASGRPGPNVITGTLRRSINHDPVTPWGVRGWETRIGPTVIYGRRVELGFRGADSLGRVYNQPGYPYFGPAFRASGSRIRAIYVMHMAAALAG